MHKIVQSVTSPLLSWRTGSVLFFLFIYFLLSITQSGYVLACYSIYGVHDEAKDKAFELEMSWVCEESNREHQRVSLLFFVPFLTFWSLC